MDDHCGAENLVAQPFHVRQRAQQMAQRGHPLRRAHSKHRAEFKDSGGRGGLNRGKDRVCARRIGLEETLLIGGIGKLLLDGADIELRGVAAVPLTDNPRADDGPAQRRDERERAHHLALVLATPVHGKPLLLPVDA